MLSATRKFGTATRGSVAVRRRRRRHPRLPRRRRPRARPRGAKNTSPEGNRPDISDILGDTVGGLLFGESPADANAMTRVLAGMPPRPPRPPRSPTRATVPSGMISPPPSPETNANASVVERQSSAKGAAGRAGRPPLVPPRKPDANFAHADADAHVGLVSLVGLVGLSPIEMVAAEVRSPPREASDARRVDAAESSSVSDSASAAASAAAAAAAAAAAVDNPWLPSRMQPLARAPQHPPPPPLPPPRLASPPSPTNAVGQPTRSRGDRLGEEWARTEDEDDALVVMLRARVANLEAQLAKFTEGRRREVERA